MYFIKQNLEVQKLKFKYSFPVRNQESDDRQEQEEDNESHIHRQTHIYPDTYTQTQTHTSNNQIINQFSYSDFIYCCTDVQTHITTHSTSYLKSCFAQF